jgi:hypothetical protein
MSLYEGYYSTCAGLRLRVCAGKEGRGGEGGMEEYGNN